MKKYWVKRLFIMVLCITMLMGTLLTPVASAATNLRKTNATFTCTTMNDSLKWVCGRKSTVTFKNCGDGNLKIVPSVKGCTVSPKSKVIYPGQSATFTITTSFAKTGTTKFSLVNTFGCPIIYEMKSSGVQMILRS